MGSTKMTGKTIGEEEKLTSIPKRKLKYMIERDLMRPSQQTESGFWLYSEEDIQVTHSIALFQQLGYPEKDIRAPSPSRLCSGRRLWSDRSFNWQKRITK